MVQHEVAPVAEEGVHLALGGGHLHAQRPRDLIAHAGVPVLGVVVARLAALPELVEVAGQASRRVDDGGALARVLVEDADDLGLMQGRLRLARGMDDLVPGLLPLLARLGHRPRVVGGHPVGPQGGAEVGQARPRVRHQGQGAVLVRVVRGEVEGHEAHAGILELRLGGRGEVAQAGSHRDHEVRPGRDAVRGQGPGDAERAQALRVRVGQRPLAGLGHGHGDARGLGQRAQRVLRFRVPDAAPGDDEGPARLAHEGGGGGQGLGLGTGPPHAPDAPKEKVGGIVVGLGLHVLGEGEGDRARGRGIGQHAHGLGQSGQELLRPVDAVPVAGDGTEAVVDAQVHAVRRLELLQHGRGQAAREDVAGQEEHGQAVDGGGGGSRDHVGGARAHGRRAGEGAQPAPRLGEGDRGVHHGLLVLGLVVGQLLPTQLVQGLAQPRHVPVAEDAEYAVDEAVLHAVALDVLELEELHDRAGGGEPPRLRAHAPSCGE